MKKMLVSAGLLFAFTFTALAEDAKPKSDPAGVAVELRLVAKKDTYALDLGGKTAAEFKQLLKESEKKGGFGGGGFPPAPAVDLVLEIHNTGKTDVQVWIGGDPTVFTLDLQGPGAASATVARAFTREFRLPKAEKIAPGKSHAMPVTLLQYGFRGVAQRAWWTEPGDYTLTASFKTGLSPAPKGAKDDMGFGQVTLTSAPVKLKVEKK